MPMSMRGLGCVLMLVALTGSYGLAGAAAATLTLSQAFTAPWLGRLADGHGQRRLLVLALAAHASGTLLLVLAAQVGAPAWTLGMVAFARERGSPGAAGPLLALFATGSMLAGLAYGAREWRTPHDLRFLIATTALCAGTVPILLADGIVTMALSVAIGGVGIAPALIASSTLVEELLPRVALVEGLTWVVTALTVGAAAGAALAGAAIDLAGSRAAFAAALAAGLISVLVAVIGRGSLRPKRP
jgi:MFS family permease